MFSFGIEPSMTSTNGFAASPRAAARNGVRNSSPPSVGERTLLWRLTFGIPGIAPSSTSSSEGWPAAVTDTESPSQLIPSEIQRMFTSCTPGGLTGSLAIDRPSLRHQSLFEFERVDEHLLTAEDVEREAAAPRALQREVREHADRAAVHAPPLGGHDLEHQLGSLDRRPGGDEIE